MQVGSGGGAPDRRDGADGLSVAKAVWRYGTLSDEAVERTGKGESASTGAVSDLALDKPILTEAAR